MDCRAVRSLAVCLCAAVLLPAPIRAELNGVREVISPRLTEAVIVNGKLEEPAWGQAAKLQRLVTLGDGAKTERYHTEARVVHSGEALCIAVECLAAAEGAGLNRVRLGNVNLLV